MRTVNFWLYVFCLFVSFGGGNCACHLCICAFEVFAPVHRFNRVVYTVYFVDVNANIAQIVQASGERPAAIPFLITIMSLASCLSRVVVGATAQLFEDAGLPRTLFVLGSVTCMLGSQLCLATATTSGLYIGATLGQFGYGACCTMLRNPASVHCSTS